jgi:hypothetical protein
MERFGIERFAMASGMTARIGSALLICLLVSSSLPAASVTILADRDSPQAAFAAEELRSALRARDHAVRSSGLTPSRQDVHGVRIVLCPRSNDRLLREMQIKGARDIGTLEPEGYSIRVTDWEGRTTYWVVGADEAGVMYGGLELAEVVTVDDLDGIAEVDHSPYMAMRGTKFNCPLDVRTPSYTDVCDAAQHNIAEMWSFDFWRAYIDSLARYRYNFVSLWSLHPFPSLVKVPDYPDVALDDVKRSTVQWKERYSLNGIGFDAPEILNNTETLKAMTIGEKADF